MVDTTPKTREQWLEERLTGIGASESPTVLGRNPFQSRYALWAEKTREATPRDLRDVEAVEFGRRFETPVAEVYGEKSGRLVEMWPAFSIVRDPERNHVFSTPDAVQLCEERGEGLLQIKTTGEFKAKAWKYEPPLAYQIQLQQELHCTGYEWGTLCVLIGGQRIRWFDIQRNDRFIDAMLPQLDRFWSMVQSKTPPEVDDSIATTEVLDRLHPDDTGRMIILPPEAAGWTADIEHANKLIRDAQRVKQLATNRLKAAIGDATYGLFLDNPTRWVWKTENRRRRVVDAHTVRVLRKKR